jgi:hypothetical protein
LLSSTSNTFGAKGETSAALALVGDVEKSTTQQATGNEGAFTAFLPNWPALSSAFSS